MKRKFIFVIIIFAIILITQSIYAIEPRISEEELQESRYTEGEEISRESAEELLSSVVEEWDISATEEDNVIATLYDDGRLIISGTGRMKDYEYDSPFFTSENIFSVTIEEGITNIGNGAFRICYQLSQIEIPNTVRIIGEGAFESCFILESITIPDSVIQIGTRAFFDCESLNTIEIGSNVKVIDYNFFENCFNLSNINISEDNQYYSSIDGVIFNKNKTELILYPIGKLETIYTIPNSVEVINENAFNNCWNLTAVNVSSENTNLLSIDGVLFNKEKTELILYPACKEGTTYTIPSTVKVIRGKAFEWCQELTSIIIPEGVTNIGDRAFNACSGLTTVKIPSSVITIGDEAFFYCNSLTEINVDAKNTKYISEDGVLFNKEKTELILYPACKEGATYTIPSTVKVIGESAFEMCAGLTSVIMQEGVKDIGKAAFCACINLKSIEMSNTIINIGEAAFYNCSSLENIIIPEGVTIIEDEIFSECFSLKEVVLPNGITDIQKEAFYDCSSLENITIPTSVTNIGGYAFYYCSSLTNITIPDGVTSIGYSAFAGCSGLTSITIPKGLTRIEDSAFCYCSSLTSITIPGGVTSIEYGAFAGCSGLTNITIPSGVQNIEEGVFNWCENLEEINVDTENEYYSSENGILFNKDKTTIIKYPEGNIHITEYKIPNTVNKIEEDAFRCCKRLSKVEIPVSVIKIDKAAFSGYNFDAEIVVYCGSYAEKFLKEEYDSILSVIHNSEELEVVPGTCIEQGYTVYKCTNCEETYNDNYVYGEHHEEIIEGVEATCTESGLTEGKYCSICDEVLAEQEVIETLGHTEVVEEEVKATCIETGLTQGKYCSMCNEVLVRQEVIEITGHTEAIIEEVKATCTETGLTEGKYCSVCNEMLVEQEEIPALGHNFSTEWTVDFEPTCTTAGLKSYHCINCGKKKNITLISKIPHTYGEWYVTKEATCTEAGTREQVCSACEDKRTEVIDALGHRYSDWLVNVKPTYKSAGERQRTCSICNCLEKEAIEILMPIIEYDTLGASANDNVKAEIYVYDNDYTIVIRDTGQMKDFAGELPWKDYKDKIVKAVIEEGVTNIGANTFSGVNNLKEVEVADSVTTIGKNAFYDTDIEKFIMSDNITDIGEKAFYLNSSLTYVKLSNNLKEIGKEAFGWCSNLTNIEIPNGVTIIGARAFEYCKGNKNLYIPESVTEIQTAAFSSWKDLESVEIANGVITLGIHPFFDCDNLVKITVPDNVQTIDDNLGTCSIVKDCDNVTAYCRIGSAAHEHFEKFNVNYVVDNDNPITDVIVSERDWTNQDVTITIEANDELSGLSKYAYSFDGGETWQEENYKTYSQYTEGIKIQVKDCLYNTEEYSEEITVYIDKVNPEISNVTGNVENWTNQDVTLTVVATDDLSGSGVESYSFDNGTTWQKECYKTYSENTEGIKIKVKDKAGNITEYRDIIDITKIDKVDPSIRIVTGEREACESTVLTIEATDDLSGLQAAAYSFDNGITWQESNQKEYTQSEENIVIQVRDNAGNIVSYIENINITIGHIEVINRAVEPTCTDTGLTEGKTCSRCKRILVEQEVVPALGHAEVIKDAVAPTCTDIGLTEGKTCSRCNEVLVRQEVIAAKGHNYSEEWTVDVEATCTVVGSKSHHCTRENCDSKSDITEIEMIPHNYGEWVITTPATCEEVGSKEKVCSVCQDRQTEELPVLGHEYEANVTEPTCTEKGYTTHTCTRCEGTYIDTHTDATGHKYEIIHKDDAVCEQGGKIIYKCQACEDSYEDEIEAIGHREVIDERTEPTDIQTGLTQGSHCSVCGETIIAQEIIPSLKVILQTWDISAKENDNVIAYLCEDKTLIISGTGNMKDYSINNIENNEYSPWHESRNDITNVQIESGINNIGNAAFYLCRQLINITIPEGLSNIGDNAFYYCTSLTKIILPESISNIGNNAFSKCINLSDITIPNNVTQISRGLFYDCDKLESINIPEGVTTIGRSSFSGCNSLTNIDIPASVKIIEEYSFWGCDNIGSIEVDEKNSCFMDVEGVLFNKDKTELIYYPSNKSDKEYIIPETVETIKACSISFCKNLENVIISEGIKNIEEANFYYCYNLRNITIPRTVTNIKGGILSNCTRLEKIDVYCNTYVENYINQQDYKDKLNIIHTEVIDAAVAATCTETGFTEGKHCSICEKVLISQEQIMATGHAYTEEWIVDVDPTCTLEGSKSYHCMNGDCDSKSDITVIEMLPHNYGEWMITIPATCVEIGAKERVCSVCQDKQTGEVEVLGHTYSEEWTVDLEPTCISVGSKSHHCINEGCDSKSDVTEIEMIPHSFGIWIIDREPTYEEEGHKYRICTICNEETEEQVIPNLSEQALEVQTTYTVKEQDGQKYVVMSSAKEVQEILSNITSNKDLQIVDKSGNIFEDTTKVGTGAKVVEKYSKEVVYTIVVKGDADGDAKIDFIKDLIRFNNYRLNLIRLDIASILAGDVNEDGKIEFIQDIIRINNYRLGIINAL